MRIENLALWSCMAALISPVSAFAGPGGTTCATAERLSAFATYVGDTSAPGYGNPIGGMGPLPSPANDAIYYFVPDGFEQQPITVISASYNFAIFLLPDCQPAASPPIQGATGPTPPAFLQVSGLTAGVTYYVVMSGNPSDQSAPEGAYTFTTADIGGGFPITLQSFTID